MKATRSIYKLALVALFAASCNKLVDIPDHPPTQVSESHVFSDSADIISAVAGVYSSFKSNTAAGGLTNYLITLSTGLTSDELSTTATGYTPEQANNMVNTDPNSQGMWTSAYASLYVTNTCITGISNTNAISDSLKAQLVAEMKVVRAFFYFQMVNIWGGVPLVTSSDYNITAKQPRASVEDVYALIQSDLAAARATLTTTYPSTTGHFRANLYVAQALSAKVFLYRQQWDSAAMMANSIINSGGYSLVTDLSAVYLNGSQETIWAMPGGGSPGNSSSTGNYYYQTGEGSALLPISQYSAPTITVSPILLSSFEPGDKRYKTWVDSINVFGKNYFIPYKYRNRSNSGYPAPTTKEDYTLFRLADIYLVAAEAQAEKGDSANAITNLNMVRSRAGLTGYAGTNLLAAIQQERRIELCYEWGNRWFDLKRTGTIDAILGAEKPNWTKTDAWFPIPATQILANPFLTQNDGY
jgi:starch-binding outer membrane protein, SusD/RagB family